MQLTHIAIDKLSISTANMRHGKRPPDVSDILPSVDAALDAVPDPGLSGEQRPSDRRKVGRN
jgi:hypothetical protein